MFAVIQAGGHQYKVAQGDTITVDYINGKEGDKVTFDKVLMVGGAKQVVGTPLVSGAAVHGVIKTQTRNAKEVVFKYKRRKNYKRTRGHKQVVSVVEINSIKA